MIHNSVPGEGTRHRYCHFFSQLECHCWETVSDPGPPGTPFLLPNPPLDPGQRERRCFCVTSQLARMEKEEHRLGTDCPDRVLPLSRSSRMRLGKTGMITALSSGDCEDSTS